MKSGKTYHNGLRFLWIQTQTILRDSDIQSIKVSIHTTNAFIEAARIIVQIELHTITVHIKLTEVDLGKQYR
jgi:hypothetical protein